MPHTVGLFPLQKMAVRQLDQGHLAMSFIIGSLVQTCSRRNKTGSAVFYSSAQSYLTFQNQSRMQSHESKLLHYSISVHSFINSMTERKPTLKF